MVGKVLAAQSDLGCPGPYIPTFYQLKENMHVHSCESSKVSTSVQYDHIKFNFSERVELTTFHSQNALMQQPLAHLYFLMVLEHLQTRKYQPNHLVRLAGRMAVVGDYKCI